MLSEQEEDIQKEVERHLDDIIARNFFATESTVKTAQLVCECCDESVKAFFPREKKGIDRMVMKFDLGKLNRHKENKVKINF